MSVTMDINQASQISEILNARNQLVRNYTAQDIHDARETYVFEIAEDGSVTGCVEVKRVQWYQFEIDHLCVIKSVEGKGIGSTLLNKAEMIARNAGCRVLQCTIREANKPSEILFGRNGFNRVSEFYNYASGNNVGVWQKVIVKMPRVENPRP
jgi:ribosomal protein S18 acetylase RimI-like enzyme